MQRATLIIPEKDCVPCKTTRQHIFEFIRVFYSNDDTKQAKVLYKKKCFRCGFKTISEMKTKEWIDLITVARDQEHLVTKKGDPDARFCYNHKAKAL
jgi:hypothetical protein